MTIKPDNTTNLPTLLLSGIDSLYVSYYVNHPTIDWEELHFLKEKLKADRKTRFLELTLGTLKLALLPSGTGQYTFQLQHRDYRILLSENNMPNIQVQYSSQGLWLRGIKALTAEIENWIKSLKGHPQREASITRADFAFDFNLPLIDFSVEDFVSRAGKDSIWRNRGAVETFSFGKGDIVVRVYDKVAEIEQQSHKYWLYDLWGQREGVWRVEFQIRAERLKKAGIVTLDDLSDFGTDLLRELVTGHTSLRIRGADTNRSRWPYHPLWQALIDHIEEMPQTGLVTSYRPGNGLQYRLYKQIQSFYGSLKGLAATFTALKGCEEPVSLEETMDRVFFEFDDFHCPQLWEQAIAKRMAAREYGI